MSNAQLISLTLERFKSYKERTEIPLTPLTVVIGRNNSGKSTIIQALLLLKQTLELPRTEVPLHLEGYVDAASLRELTYGWPDDAMGARGPRIGLKWRAQLTNSTDSKEFSLDLSFGFRENRIVVETVEVAGFSALAALYIIHCEARCVLQESGRYLMESSDGGGALPPKLVDLGFWHFLPILMLGSKDDEDDSVRRRRFDVGLVFRSLAETLQPCLSTLRYLGSSRAEPPSLYRPSSVPPEDLGVSGEYAAQMLQARKNDRVHYVLPVLPHDSIGEMKVRSRPLADSVNDVFESLGVESGISIHDIKDVGFRLLFGKSSVQHVGRGLSSMLPMIELGLIADPLRYENVGSDLALSIYDLLCKEYAHLAFEEPEAHVHPKVQTRLAHWMVALAMARRRIIVETHSDHFVRSLRRLAAEAPAGSEMEKWLLENVVIIEVDQQNGESRIKAEKLTRQGEIESWPADFMDEATDQESAIYHASLDKPARAAEPVPHHVVEHDAGDEPEDP